MTTYRAGTKITIDQHDHDGNYSGLITLELTEDSIAESDGDTITLTGYRRVGPIGFGHRETQTISASGRFVRALS